MVFRVSDDGFKGFDELIAATQCAHFAILDLRLVLDQDGAAPRSWEVEREHFMRGLATDPRDDD